MLALTIATILIMAIAPVPSIAREQGFSDPEIEQLDTEFRQEKRLHRLTSLLELTDEQAASIETVNEIFSEQINTLHESMKENHDILRTLAKAAPVDINAIQQVADAQGDLYSDLVILKTEKHIAFAAILSQYQLEKLEELRATVEEHRNTGDKKEVDETIN
jgi:Spy/CpxP family protein refolding chaperone